MDPTHDALPESMRPKRSASALIFLIVFLDLLGVGLIVPLTPFIVERFNSTGTAVAMLTMAYSAAQFVATPVLGVLSDRFGRRPILLASLFGSSIGYVIFATAGVLPLLYLSRIIDGFTGGNISTAQAYIADVTPKKDRAKAYGLVGAAFGLGFLLGPAFSAMLSQISLMAPVWAAAGLSLVTMTLVAAFLPETLPPEARRTKPIGFHDLNPASVLVRTMRIPAVAAMLAAIFAAAFAHAELRASLGVLLRDKFAFNETHVGWVFTFIGFVAVMVQGGLVRRVSPKIGDRRAVLFGLPIAVLGYVLIPLAPVAHWGWLLGALALMGLGAGVAGPSLTGILSRAAPAGEEGQVMGASQSISALALVFGPLLAGPLYDHVGKAWPFWSAAAVIFVSLVIVAVKRVGKDEHAPDPLIAAEAETF
ncbi:MAG: MFS transporter [Phycisphaerales bacterium]